MGIDLEQLQADHSVWLAHNFPDQTPHQGLLGVVEEVGELAHAHLKAEQGIRGMDSVFDQMARKADAVGDIIIFLCGYCSNNGLDLSKCVERAWDEVKDRDWQANPTDGRVA